ncbi:hypothetical protein GGI25_000060 [Coemansia spiralis]|uniref:Mitochondrial PGP phosphatase n=2 Tax=Coemansia TaxID=4863 RepID=A0A9W8GCS0_9FUNG|nr:mitochondrial PGP phosphatase-domain-containing protein [Coemansia spiralis]KAJ1992559.1 hypothetical protein EDC05_002705 [Coemansia umbellata]KAJ2623061.1 hypothetical protein GGI26_002670 [Coemansia sp. RSA 1358]KAJ2681105.1 hypothetical protein GGI25_000060 [Coemansia spiralis]
MVQWFNAAGVRSVIEVVTRPRLLLPHMVVPDIRSLPLEVLQRRGIRFLVFDKDNCLTAPYSTHLHPPFATAWLRCKTLFPGRILVVSNSAGTKDDHAHSEAAAIERALGVPVLRHAVKKPGCAAEILEKLGQMACQAAGPGHIAVVGDRLATDIVLANKAHMLAIWTTEIIARKGDSAVAAALRQIEHRAYRVLRRAGIRAPPHESGIPDCAAAPSQKEAKQKNKTK